MGGTLRHEIDQAPGQQVRRHGDLERKAFFIERRGNARHRPKRAVFFAVDDRPFSRRVHDAHAPEVFGGYEKVAVVGHHDEVVAPGLEIERYGNNDGLVGIGTGGHQNDAEHDKADKDASSPH
jgi:hypothetical protein